MICWKSPWPTWGREYVGARVRGGTTQESKNILASTLSGGPRIIFSGASLVLVRGKIIPNGRPATQIGAACFLIAIRGGGPYSVDRMIGREL